MKTQFSRRASTFLTGHRLALTVLAGVVVLLILLRIIFPSFFYGIFTPLWQVGDTLTHTLGIGESVEEVRAERDHLRDENETLTAQIRNLTSEQALDEILPTGKGVTVNVLSRPPVSPYDVLIISGGTKDGIESGAMVYAMGGVPVGLVQDAGLRESRVVLYSSPLYATEGWVGEERNPITVVGAGAGAVEANLAHDVPVVAGDIVYLPGPGGIPYGAVVQVVEQASSPQKAVHIRPYINPFTLTRVVVNVPL